jgi:RNA polymerase sigma factor (sigma-70 family)
MKREQQRDLLRDFEPWEVAVAVNCVAAFVDPGYRGPGYHFGDLLTEALVAWTQAKPEYRPHLGVSPGTYMAAVVRNRLCDLMRHRGRQKRRGDAEALSLDASHGCDPEAAPLSDSVPDAAAQDALRAVEVGLWRTQIESRLTPRERRLLALLEQDTSMEDAAEQLGVSRQTLSKARARLKRLYLDRDLGEFQN